MLKREKILILKINKKKNLLFKTFRFLPTFRLNKRLITLNPKCRYIFTFS